MVRVRFEFDDARLRRNLESIPDRIDQTIAAVVDRAAAKGEAHLKNDAPWTDRTGAARAGLHTTSSSGGGKHEIVFAHTVHYGIWLEIANSGRYEVIMPTVIKTGRELMDDLGSVFGGMK